MLSMLFLSLVQLPIGQWEPVSPCLTFDAQNTLEWPNDPTFGSAAGFGRVVVAQLDGDGLADAVVLADGVPVVMWNVAFQDALESMDFALADPPVGVTDVATLPGGGTEGRDALVMSDARGLYLVSFDEGGFSEPLVIGAVPYAEKIHVDHLDTGPNAELDVLSLGADRRTVYKSLQAGGLFTTSIAVVEPHNTFDVVAVNWDEDELGVREIVAVTGRGLAVHTLSGTLVGGVIHYASSGCIARVETDAVEGGEIVAWTRPVAGAASQLLLRSATLTDCQWALEFGACGPQFQVHPTAILAGRYDADEHDDLLLVHQGAATAIVLGNLAGDAFFNPQDTGAFDVLSLAPAPAGSGVGIPAFTEVDGGGAFDIVAPVTSTERVEVFLHYPHVRALQGAPTTSADVFLGATEFGPETDGNRLRLAFEIPGAYLNSTHVEVKAWRQAADGALLDPNTLAYSRYDLSMQGDTLFPRQWVRVNPSFPAYDDAENPCWNAPRPNYYVQLRFARQTAMGYLRSPAFVGGFTLEQCTDHTGYDYLEFLRIPGSDPIALYEDNGTALIDRNQLGLFVPMSSTPPFPQNDPPTNPPAITGLFANPLGEQ